MFIVTKFYHNLQSNLENKNNYYGTYQCEKNTGHSFQI